MKKSRLFLSAVLALSISVTMLSACGDTGSDSSASTSSSDDTIKIGVFQPLTGANAAGGEMEKAGTDLAYKLRPKVGDRDVEMVVADNKSDKVEAATVAERLVSQDKVSAVVGSWGSSFSIAAGPIFEENEVTAVGASCTNPLVTLGNNYYVRVCFIDSFQGKMIAKYAVEELGAKTAAIIIEKSNDYSVGLASFITAAMKEYTGDENAIVATAEYSTGDQDFNAQLTQIGKANPDVIFAPGNFTEGAMIVKQARQQGLEQRFLACDTWVTPDFLAIGGDAVDGVIVSTFFDANADLTPKTQEFVKAYREEYNEDPSGFAALSFDAYNLVMDAIEQVGTDDPVKLNEAIRNTKDWEGVTGFITLDENGDATKGVVFNEVKDGAFTYIGSLSADEANS